MIQDTIYVVTNEWSSCNGDHEFSVFFVSFDLKKAVQSMEKERNLILKESYNIDSIEEDTMRFFISDDTLFDKWDEIKICERLVTQRDFIVVSFEYSGEKFEERIYIDDVDLTHYDTLWDWWFKSDNKKFPDLNFELTANKDDDGNISSDGMYINVYEDEDSLQAIKTINKVKWQHSWIERKQNYVGK